MTNYIEEIRSAKFKYDLILNGISSNPNNQIYNNTLYGSSFDTSPLSIINVGIPNTGKTINNDDISKNSSRLNVNANSLDNSKNENHLNVMSVEIVSNKVNAESINITNNSILNSSITSANDANSIKNSTSNINTKSNTYDTLYIFNENSIRNLGLLNRFMIRPAYEALKQKLESSITNSLNTFRLIYIIVLSIFISGILFIYMFLWRPFENRLNATVIFIFIIKIKKIFFESNKIYIFQIYKTKNMLSIIPKEVLANLTNIHKLLDIGQNLSKNNKKNNNNRNTKNKPPADANPSNAKKNDQISTNNTMNN